MNDSEELCIGLFSLLGVAVFAFICIYLGGDFFTAILFVIILVITTLSEGGQ